MTQMIPDVDAVYNIAYGIVHAARHYANVRATVINPDTGVEVERFCRVLPVAILVETCADNQGIATGTITFGISEGTGRPQWSASGGPAGEQQFPFDAHPNHILRAAIIGPCWSWN